MDPYRTIAHPAAWQESWDRQQQAYLPDREHRIAAMLDTVAAAIDNRQLRLLDLAGGTGTISLRALHRFPDAQVTLVDQDPVLLAIATASLSGRATIVTADLNDTAWITTLPHRQFNAVLATTALHWLTPERLRGLYREIHDLLQPGGLIINADHMPDDGLPTLTTRLTAAADHTHQTRCHTGAALSWNAWWERIAADPVLAPLHERRTQSYPDRHHTEWNPPMSWHLAALRDAGYAEAGLVWRGAADAAVTGVR